MILFLTVEFYLKRYFDLNQRCDCQWFEKSVACPAPSIFAMILWNLCDSHTDRIRMKLNVLDYKLLLCCAQHQQLRWRMQMQPLYNLKEEEELIAKAA